MEPSPESEGAFLDLAHAISLFHNKELHVNDEELFRHADFIYFAAGTPNTREGSRLSRAQQNIQLSREIFEQPTFVRNPYVIVITNPVDIVSHAVYHYSGLSRDRVMGTGTFLDSVRLQYYLSTLSGVDTCDIDAVVLGEHGESQVPIYSLSRVEGKPILDGDKFSKQDLEHAIALTKDAAFQIRETQDGTTYGVSKCAEVLLDYLLGVEEHTISLSMCTNDHYRSLLSLNHDIFIGIPVTIKNGEIRIENRVALLEEELDAYRASARILAEIVEENLLNN